MYAFGVFTPRALSLGVCWMGRGTVNFSMMYIVCLFITAQEVNVKARKFYGDCICMDLPELVSLAGPVQIAQLVTADSYPSTPPPPIPYCLPIPSAKFPSIGVE